MLCLTSNDYAGRFRKIRLTLYLIDDLLHPVRDSAQIAILNIGVNIERPLDIVMANDHWRSVSDDRCEIGQQLRLRHGLLGQELRLWRWRCNNGRII